MDQLPDHFRILPVFLYAKHHIVPDIQPRHQPRFLEDKRSLMVSIPQNLTAIRFFQPAGQAQKRRFSTTALSQDHRDRSSWNIQIDAI